MKWLQLGSLLFLLVACAYKSDLKDVEKYENEFSKDDFQERGLYSWKFQLVGKEQTSTHQFFEDSILYKMEGSIYSTEYPMYKLSYEAKEQKWIGKDNKGIVYVLYFKDKTDTSITIYKHKCKKKGLREALDFSYPKPDATTDHGWNVYSLKGFDNESVLPVSGMFSNGKETISIHDKTIEIGDRSVKKLSFHKGERRWVGQYENEYLQIFFKSFEDEVLEINMHWSEDLESLYKTKYPSTDNWEVYHQQ
ncbi:MAG: hypothetical protein CSA38_03550 [Flavobacteriales bacterium]|nr:MAG: hypothetical protein CSA38_03550 [Flavobacteriales bacterium]